VQYPLDIRFKLWAFSQQVAVRDANKNTVLFVKQKMFRLKEKVEVFSDSKLKDKLFDIQADRILDFSANYRFTASDGSDWGSVRRRGMRSLWSAHYEIFENNAIEMHLREESPWKKLIESVLGELPIIGFIFVFLLNPSYLITKADGRPVLRVLKKPSFFERYFVIEKIGEIDEDDELRALLSLLMMVLLEKRRG